MYPVILFIYLKSMRWKYPFNLTAIRKNVPGALHNNNPRMPWVTTANLHSPVYFAVVTEALAAFRFL